MLYEVELTWIDDIPALKAAVKVLGNVKSTSRYGTTGPGWGGGSWIENISFDSTLQDRFIIDTTEEKAIALSAEPWVGWTAPMLEGTQWEISLLPLVISLISGTLGTLLTMWGLS